METSRRMSTSPSSHRSHLAPSLGALADHRVVADPLGLYNRNSDWDLSVCTIPTKGFDPCPENAKRFRDFPTALREHLVANGYNLTGIGGVPAATVSPSFDCNKARTPTEIEICRSPRLAELDNVLAAGYAFIKATQGRPAADVIGIPHWKLIR